MWSEVSINTCEQSNIGWEALPCYCQRLTTAFIIFSGFLRWINWKASNFVPFLVNSETFSRDLKVMNAFYNQTIVHQYLDLLLSVLSILLGGDFCNWYNVQKQPLIALVPSNTLNIAFLSLKDFVAKIFLMTSIISEVFHVKFTIPRLWQIVYTKPKCTPASLLCAPSFWKPYKVFYFNIVCFYFRAFTLTLFSSLIENCFIFCLSQSFDLNV